MLGCKERGQLELFITGSLRQLVPDDHILAKSIGCWISPGFGAKWRASTATTTAGRGLIRRLRFG